MGISYSYQQRQVNSGHLLLILVNKIAPIGSGTMISLEIHQRLLGEFLMWSQVLIRLVTWKYGKNCFIVNKHQHRKAFHGETPVGDIVSHRIPYIHNL